ncbi:MAG: hypothetical protein HYY93_10315 [Planctomycetes bacterium]|nr:hypothetical protein [Planctomycetota bacterium]
MAIDPNRLQRPEPGDLFALWNEHGLEYLVLGAQAAILYGLGRSSFDVDILLRQNTENAERFIAAMGRVGFGIAREIRPEDLFHRPFFAIADQCKVDVFTVVPLVGARYEECFPRREVIVVAGVSVPCLALDTLIASKDGTGRPKDQQDVLELRRLLDMRTNSE